MRIFEHLEGTPEDRRLSRVAHEMKRSAWWETVPTYTQPTDASGEIRLMNERPRECAEQPVNQESNQR